MCSLIVFFLSFFIDILPRSAAKVWFQKLADFIFATIVFPLTMVSVTITTVTITTVTSNILTTGSEQISISSCIASISAYF